MIGVLSIGQRKMENDRIVLSDCGTSKWHRVVDRYGTIASNALQQMRNRVACSARAIWTSNEQCDDFRMSDLQTSWQYMSGGEMNEKIRELIEQSHILIPHEREWNVNVKTFSKEKFVNLLLNEVIEIVQWYPEVHNQREQDVLNQAVGRIIELYGVKYENPND